MLLKNLCNYVNYSTIRQGDLHHYNVLCTGVLMFCLDLLPPRNCEIVRKMGRVALAERGVACLKSWPYPALAANQEQLTVRSCLQAGSDSASSSPIWQAADGRRSGTGHPFIAQLYLVCAVRPNNLVEVMHLHGDREGKEG